MKDKDNVQNEWRRLRSLLYHFLSTIPNSVVSLSTKDGARCPLPDS